MLSSLALIFLAGYALASAAQALRLPRIIGMLAAGILLGPYALNLLAPPLLAISADLRQMALVIILIKAGLSLNLRDLKKVGRPALLMAFLPALFEILAFLLFAPLVLHLERAEAAVMGAVLAAVTALVLAGGIKRVGRLCELLVPAMALLFVGSGLAVIAVNWQAVPMAFQQIVGYAFAPRAVAGGYSMGMALRYGVARGVFTNEAGLGMSAIAHACADVEEPAEQGMWGIFEVFFATMVICTVTALVILTSGVYDPARTLPLAESGAVPDGMLGAPLTAAGFASLFGEAGEWIVSVSLILFAFTSLLGSGYYGQRGIECLTSARWARWLYRLAFPACAVLGAAGDITAVWQLVDAFNGLLAAVNLPALLLLSPEALHLLRSWLAGRKISGAAGAGDVCGPSDAAVFLAVCLLQPEGGACLCGGRADAAQHPSGTGRISHFRAGIPGGSERKYF